MKCIMCSNKMTLKKKTVTVKYKECGLDNVTLRGAERYHCLQCGEEYLNLGNLDELHCLLAHALVLKKGLLNGNEIRFLRTYLGYSTKVFAKLTGYDPATLSRFENSRQPISYPFNILVRSLVANCLPNREYGLHEKWLKNEGKSTRHIEIISNRKKWRIAKHAA